MEDSYSSVMSAELVHDELSSMSIEQHVGRLFKRWAFWIGVADFSLYYHLLMMLQTANNAYVIKLMSSGLSLSHHTITITVTVMITTQCQPAPQPSQVHT